MKNSFEKSNSPCVETIAVVNGKAPLLKYHQARMNDTFRRLYQCPNTFTLFIPPFPYYKNLMYKWRIIYSRDTFLDTITPYHPMQIKNLYPVEVTEIEYSFKYEDRNKLNNLQNKIKNRIHSTILITRDGYITDTIYHNIFLIKNEQLYTPSNPLLKGTQRTFILNHYQVVERLIHLEEVEEFDEIKLVNAFNPLPFANSLKPSDILLTYSP